MNTKKNFIGKIISIVLLFGILGLLLYAFYLEEKIFSNFKFYYITKIYVPIYSDIAKNTLKNFYTANVLSILGVNAKKISVNSENNGFAKSVPVLLYHGVVNESDGFNVFVDDFREQMFLLKKLGWQAISLADFEDFTEGKKKLPEKSFLITFDDGRKDSYYPVDPILKALDYHAVIFIIANTLDSNMQDQKFYLDKEEINRMIDSGRWEIETHTDNGHNLYPTDKEGGVGHFYSYKLWISEQQRLETDTEYKNRILYDFISGKRKIEDNFKITSDYFAFPFGDYGQNFTNYPEAEKTVINTAGKVYKGVFYQTWPGNNFIFNYPEKKSNPVMIKRVSIEEGLSPNQLAKMLSAAEEKTFPHIDLFNENIGAWSGIEENSKIGDHKFTLKPGNNRNYKITFLDGTYTWTNYKFEAKLGEVKGETISIIARYQNSKNFIGCSYTDESVYVEEYLDGKRRVLTSFPKKLGPRSNMRITIEVNENNAKCFIEDMLVVESNQLPETLNHGGIGFKIWDPQPNASLLTVTEIYADKYSSQTKLVNKNE